MTRPNQPFISDATQREKRETLANDRRASTYHQFKLPEEELGGRYRKLEPQTIVGSSYPIPSYARSAPWSSTQLPDEPPTNYRIDEMDPVGEFHEVEASIGNDRSRVAYDDATTPSVASESEEPRQHQHAPHSTPVGGGGGTAASDQHQSLKRAAPLFKPRI